MNSENCIFPRFTLSEKLSVLHLSTDYDNILQTFKEQWINKIRKIILTNLFVYNICFCSNPSETQKTLIKFFFSNISGYTQGVHGGTDKWIALILYV